MKPTLYIFLCWLAGLTLASAQNNTVRLVNSTAQALTDQPIIISRAELSKMVSSIPVGMVPYLRTSDNTNVPCQADDLNGDGYWDELAFVYSLAPKEKVLLQILFASRDMLPAVTPRVHARLGKSAQKDNQFTVVKNEVLAEDHAPQASPMLYQMEGPGWENDKVGFRLYFDARNSKDIFGKTKPHLIMDSIRWEADYKTMQSWGMDILEVGNSLGAGALAMWEEGKLIRLGETVGKTSYELVSDGPVRALIRLKYDDWRVNNQSYNLVEEISIWAGKHWYQSTVTLSGFSGERTLVTGIANRHNAKPVQLKTTGGYQLLATHAAQSENKDKLGMGILVPADAFMEYGEAPNEGAGVTHTSCVKLKVKNNKPVSYYFFAGWEQADKQFADEAAFITYMQQSAAELNEPPVKVSRGK
jgi:hypothetical protein